MLDFLPLVPSTSSTASPGVIIFSEFLPFFLGLLAIVVGVIFLLRFFYRRIYQMSSSFNKVILRVTVPRYESGDNDKTETQDGVREQISVAETLFSTLGGLKAERTLFSYFWGRRDHLSLEIVAHEGLISFYVVAPYQMQQFLEQHIHAQYPAANIDEVSDYNIFVPRGVTLGAYLRFSRSFIFPIKTYREIESDPLSAVTNAMSRLGQDGAAVQIVIRSAKKRWHKYGQRTASELHQGKTLKEAHIIGGGNMLVRFVNYIIRSVFHSSENNKEKELGGEKPHQLSTLEQEMAKRFEEKTSRAGMDANIRIIVSSATRIRAKEALNSLLNSFTQYNMYQYGNSFKPRRPKNQKTFIRKFIYRHFSKHEAVLLNTEELASLYHFPLSSTETPNIRWLRSKKASAPLDLPKTGVVLGENNYRGDKRIVRLDEADRRRHLYIVGTTGSGKSVLMAEMAKQDIREGKGVCVVDPHGSLVEDILASVPSSRADDVVYFDPADVERPMGLNMLEAKTPAEMDFVSQEMIAIFYKLVTDPSMIGPMFEHNMRNAMFTLMSDQENPGTIAEVPRIFTDTSFQRYKLTKVTDPMVRAFWEQEMAKTSDFHKSEMLGYIISKVGRFVENNMMRNIIGQPESAFNVREIMDSGKILLVNLSKGKIGEINSNLLGLILVSKLQMAALARADKSESELRDFYLYIDEFQNFITDSIATILSEARKYKLNLIMAHQYMGQLVNGQDTKIQDAVLGNVGTMLAFRVGVEDAEVLAKQFEPVFNEYDLVNIDRFHAYVRLLVNNSVTRPFDIDTFPPTVGDPRRAAILKQASRLRYGKDRAKVEGEISERSQLGQKSEPVAPDTALNR